MCEFFFFYPPAWPPLVVRLSWAALLGSLQILLDSATGTMGLLLYNRSRRRRRRGSMRSISTEMCTPLYAAWDWGLKAVWTTERTGVYSNYYPFYSGIWTVCLSTICSTITPSVCSKCSKASVVYLDSLPSAVMMREMFTLWLGVEVQCHRQGLQLVMPDSNYKIQ